jgi:hypothetical protein
VASSLEKAHLQVVGNFAIKEGSQCVKFSFNIVHQKCKALMYL